MTYRMKKKTSKTGWNKLGDARRLFCYAGMERRLLRRWRHRQNLA